MIGMVVVLENEFLRLKEIEENQEINKTKKWYLYKKAWYIKEYNPRGERCMREFWSQYPNNLEHIERHAQEPAIVAKDISTFLSELSEKYDWYFVADPAAFDWQWLNSFYDKFGPSDKTYLGYKSICIDGMEMCLRFLDEMHSIQVDHIKMTHLADDDAEYQAYYFMKLQAHIHEVKQRILKNLQNTL